MSNFSLGVKASQLVLFLDYSIFFAKSRLQYKLFTTYKKVKKFEHTVPSSITKLFRIEDVNDNTT